MNNRFVASSAPPEEPERPQRPTSADVALLTAAQELEFAARDLYRTALDSDALNDDAVTVFTTIHDTHAAAANNLSGLLGIAAPAVESAPIFAERAEAFAGDEAGILAAAYDLESEIVATHTDIVGRLAGTDGVAALAPVLLGEARHCPALAAVGGAGDDLAAMLDNDASSLAPAGDDSEPATSEG